MKVLRNLFALAVMAVVVFSLCYHLSYVEEHHKKFTKYFGVSVPWFAGDQELEDLEPRVAKMGNIYQHRVKIALENPTHESLVQAMNDRDEAFEIATWFGYKIVRPPEFWCADGRILTRNECSDDSRKK